MVKKQIMSIDSLYKFFVEQNKSVNFNAKDSGKPIVVTTQGTFSVEDSDTPDLLKLIMRVAHCDTNRNGSHISKENMQKFMGTLKYKPVLAYIHQCPPNNEWDFYAHNIEIVEDENGEEQINYLESQVGTFTADEPYLEYNEEMDKTYVMAKAVIVENYTKAADIIRAKGGTKISCELVINELNYNAKEKYLDLTDFYFAGCALLGRDDQGQPIGEGMEGARADIADFCHKEPVVNYQENSKLIEVLERLDTTISSLNIKSQLQKEGGEGMDELKKTVVEEEEVKEVDEAETTTETTTEEETTTEAEVSTSEDSGEETEIVETEACGGKKKKKCSIDEAGNMNVSFEISHEDTRMALYSLLCAYEEEDNEWYFISNVYDDYFIYENWDGNKLYKQGYKVDGDNVALDGDRQEMFRMILTESERIAIDKMREDYADLESKYNELSQYKSNMEQSQKDVIFASDKYVALKSSKAFAKLVEDAKNYSVEECVQKADELFDEAKKLVEQFAAAKPIEETNRSKTISVPFNVEEKKAAYGGLFEKK